VVVVRTTTSTVATAAAIPTGARLHAPFERWARLLLCFASIVRALKLVPQSSELRLELLLTPVRGLNKPAVGMSIVGKLEAQEANTVLAQVLSLSFTRSIRKAGNETM
jgi:hypothetical protein